MRVVRRLFRRLPLTRLTRLFVDDRALDPRLHKTIQNLNDDAARLFRSGRGRWYAERRRNLLKGEDGHGKSLDARDALGTALEFHPEISSRTFHNSWRHEKFKPV